MISILLLITVTSNMSGCTTLFVKVQAQDLMKDLTSNAVQRKAVDSKFISNTAEFSIDLFKKTITEKQNSLVSPISVILALAMTANGANKNTLAQMQKVLGKDIPLNELNEYLYSYIHNLPSEKKSKLTIANSIWFCDESRVTVEKDFLQMNANYYNAAAYKSAFDDQTSKDINNWVKLNTDGMIDKILDKIDVNTVMCLINAIVFDARWENVYNKKDVSDGDFTTIDGSKQNAKYMKSSELSYLSDGKATGFIKPYFGKNYSFVALLPNEDIPIREYIASLTGESFLNMIKNVEYSGLSADLPKFKYDYTIKMNDALESLGMLDAFSEYDADFSGIGTSPIGNMYIGEVLHKTFIQVDELGTKAGAVTKIEIAAKLSMDSKLLEFNRPFVYAIIDNATNLPVFIGTVMSVN